jgi:ketosteroid isomerase-like protein
MSVRRRGTTECHPGLVPGSRSDLEVGGSRVKRGRTVRLLTIVSFIALHFQTLTAQDVESLAYAERSFAQTAVDKSIRTAFLEYFTPYTIAFDKGQPVAGRKEWERRQESNGYLFWWPVYADVSASGDFGFTTGPAIYGADRTKKEATGGLYYSSVWKKDANGQWKVLADLGSSTYNPSENLTGFKTTSKPSHPVAGHPMEKKRELVALDRSYNEELMELKLSFDDGYFSDEARIYRPGKPPLTTLQQIKDYSETSKFSFQYVDAHLASTNDMALTYGTVKIADMKDGKIVGTPACYMRVWKIEDGEWNIVLDVIN